MKARIVFYCAALVALVLILAAVPSHATERRDPLIIQDTQQAQSSKPSGTSHGAKPVNASHRKNGHTAAKKSSSASANSENGAKSGTGSSTAAK